MKNTLKIMALSGAILLLGTTSAFAQTTQITAADLLPDTIDLIYELDTTTDNPIEEALLTNIKIILGFEGESFDKFETVINDNTISLGMDMDVTMEQPLSGFYASFYLSQADFDYFLDLTKDGTTIIEYQGQKIYSTGSYSYFVYLDGLVISTNSELLAKGLVDNYMDENDADLAKLPAYVNSLTHKLDGSFLNVFVNPSFIASDTFLSENGMFFDPMSTEVKLLAALKGEWISIAQTETGFSFSVYVEGDEQALLELDMPFDKYNFIPSLYSYVSGDNLILYTEQYNLTQSLIDLLAIMEGEEEINSYYEEFKTAFKEKTAVDFEVELLPLFKSNYAVFFHNYEGVAPAVTMVFNVDGNRSAIITMLSKLNGALKTQMEEEEKNMGKEFYTYGVAHAGGTAFYQHVLDLSSLFGGELDSENPQKLFLNFTLDENKLVISTHPNLDSIYKTEKGLASNATFDALFTEKGETISSVFFFDADALESYFLYLMGNTGASQSEMDFASGIFAPWHTFYGKSYADANKSWAKGVLNVDVDGFSAYPELLNQMFGYNEEYNYQYPEVLPLYEGIKFCDVSVNDWFYLYINDLTSVGITNGYDDGCFRPDNEITRAEFTKMVLGSAEMSGLYIPVSMSDQDIYFDDVPSSEWYWHYINQAAANGFVDGYLDETFRPNAPITRAEAVQILYNVSPYLQKSVNSEPFEDVAETDWYFKAVSAAYSTGLVDGTTPTSFEPIRNITRAEASKIIDEFLYLY